MTYFQSSDFSIIPKPENRNDIPIILFGREFWAKAIDFQLLADSDLIADDQLKLFKYADTALEAWEIIRKGTHV